MDLDFQQVVRLLSLAIGTDDLNTWLLGGLFTGALAFVGWSGTKAGVWGARLLWSVTLGALAVALWRRARPKQSELARAILHSLENEEPQLNRAGADTLLTGSCRIRFDRLYPSQPLIAIGTTMADSLMSRSECRRIMRRALKIAARLIADDDEQKRKLLAWRIASGRDEGSDSSVVLDGLRMMSHTSTSVGAGGSGGAWSGNVGAGGGGYSGSCG